MASNYLNKIIKHYHNSGDFNGFFLGEADASEKEQVAELITTGHIQVMAEVDYPNPHIRPWPSRRSPEQQIESVLAVGQSDYSAVCLYPTPLALKGYRVPNRFHAKPFSKAMAKGRGALELAFFTFDILEIYRNDPKYLFDFGDFGVQATISDEAYADPDEPDHDSIIMSHIGFAYDLSKFELGQEDSILTRKVCAFYSDLAKLSDVHQRRWETFEVAQGYNLNPHPVWWQQQMGQWADGLGPFQRFFFELESINELNSLAWGEPLFRTSERPSDFGWLLRPSQREWDSFVHDLDKLLSDNINKRALDAMGAIAHDPDGKPYGTLVRLDRFLQSKKVAEESVRGLLAPFREVRKARQLPAHAIRKNISDKTFTAKQVNLMHDINSSLVAMRSFWQTHPAAKSWMEPDYSSEGENYIT